MDDLEDVASLIRCSPDHDATNGFFVACFVRKTDDACDTIVPKKRKDRDNEGQPDDDTNTKQKKLKKKLKPQAGS